MNKSTGIMVVLCVAAMVILNPPNVSKAVGLGIFLGLAFSIGLFHKD